ncbi:MAG: hypothetical protein WCD70_00765 [Alphaproteobacteria bacterium]
MTLSPKIKAQVDFFVEDNGKKPAAEFMAKLKDPTTVAAIRKKLFHIQRDGLSGGEKWMTGDKTSGISELRFFAGSGIRIYFIKKPDGIVVLDISDKDKQTHKEIDLLKERRDKYAERTNAAKSAAYDQQRAAVTGEWKKGAGITKHFMPPPPSGHRNIPQTRIHP